MYKVTVCYSALFGRRPAEGGDRIMEISVSTLLTQIGALTGFLAFVFKVWEFYRDRRPSLRITYSLTGDATEGNTITILNSSKVGTIIYYFSLEALPPTRLNRLWPRFPQGFDHKEFDLEYSTVKIEVPAYGLANLNFAHADHFNWGVSRTHDLYLRIWTTARRRPMNFFVVGAGGDR
jgi:hypothetical protein